MCVIIYVDEEICQPDLNTLTRCYERNSDQHNTGKGNKDGVGIAWHNAKGEPRYIKGMYKPEEIPQLLDHHKVTIPYAIHFRASSVGNPVEGLIHPFPIDLEVPHRLDDTPSGGCVMQNGTWHGWEDKLVNVAVWHGLEIPDGPWNDARTIAWLMAVTGFNTVDRILDRNPSRLIAFLPGGVVKYRGDWQLHEGMWFSQMKWNEEPKEKKVETVVVATTTTTNTTAEKPSGSVPTIVADSFLKKDELERRNIARALKYGPNPVVTHEACLLQVMVPFDPTTGDKCGRCNANRAHRYCCKDFPDGMDCKTQGCYRPVNPKVSVDICMECIAKMAQTTEGNK
jgi:hypothetical protein